MGCVGERAGQGNKASKPSRQVPLLATCRIIQRLLMAARNAASSDAAPGATTGQPLPDGTHGALLSKQPEGLTHAIAVAHED